MISCTDSKHCCGYNAIRWIVVNDVGHVKCADDISNSFMDSFNDYIGLRIPSCNWFPFEAIVVLTHLGKFSHKMAAEIADITNKT